VENARHTCIREGRMAAIYMTLFVLGGLFCLAGLVVGYWGLLAALYPEKIRTHEIHTVVTSDVWRLRACRYRKGRTEGEPVLLVHGAAVNHHNFTMPEGGCLVDYLVDKGYDCWVLDLRGTKSSKPAFERTRLDATMDDYMLRDIPAAIDHIRRATGYARVHYVGHSLGGMMLYAYTQVYGRDYIASATALGAPTGFDNVGTKAGLFALPLIKRFPYLAADMARGAIPFALLFRTSFNIFPTNLRNLARGLGVGQLYNAIEAPMPKVVTELAHMIEKRVWRMNGDTLDVKAGLSSMKVPLLVIGGPLDPFTPKAELDAFFQALPTKDKKLLWLSKENGCEEDYGHCDLAFGREGAREVFRPIHEWMQAHPIEERVSFADFEEHEIPTPLDSRERDAILSGDSFSDARVIEAPKAAEPAKGPSRPEKAQEEPDQPAEFEPLEDESEVIKERQKVLEGIAAKAAEEKPAEPKKGPTKKTAAKKTAAAKKKTAAKKKPAAKKKAKPKKEEASKEEAKQEAEPKKKASAKKKPAAKNKAASKQEDAPKKKAASGKKAPAKKKTAAKKKAAAKKKPSAEKKSTAKKPAAKKKAAAKKKSAPKSTSSTRDVLKAASEDLKKLDKE